MPNSAPSVTILGGGPAGSALALDLTRAKCRVTLLEKGRAVTWKIGETLPSEARIELARLGLTERFARQPHLPCYGIVSVWGSAEPVEKDFLFNPYGHGWQLDRVAFETDLLAAAREAGARIQFDVTIKEINRAPAGWAVDTSLGVFRSDWLVDCTGRHAVLAGREGGRYEPLDELMALFVLGRPTHDTDQDARTYVESHADGWCYSVLLPGRARVVAFQTDADLLPPEGVTGAWIWNRLANSEIGRLLARHHYVFTTPPVAAPAHAGRYERVGGEAWLAVGDAAMTFDPLSGQGTYKSLVSARHAARTILAGEDYQEVCDIMWHDFLRERRGFYALESRWPTSPFWSRRQGVPALPTLERAPPA